MHLCTFLPQARWMDDQVPFAQSPAHQGHSLSLLSFLSCLCVLARQPYLPYGTHALSSSPSSQAQAFSSLSAGHSDPSWGQRGELRERHLCNSDGWPEGPCHLVMQLSFPLQPSLCLILDVPLPSYEGLFLGLPT